jgi:hypothetical protein
MDNTVTLQGSFVGTGNIVYLPFECGVDWIRVYNYTQSNTPTDSYGVQYNWFNGMAANDAFVSLYNAGATAITQTTAAALAVGGFTYVNSSLNLPGPIVAYTAGTNATPPVLTVASTAGLATGNIVRITSSATAYNASGLDYSIEVLSGTTFSLRNMIAPGAVFGAGTYRLIAWNPIFYPRARVITKISAAAQAVVQTSVDSGYQVGQQVRLNIPALFGAYSALDSTAGMSQSYTVVAVTAATPGNPATFTINANTTGFGAWAWPAVANVPFTPAQVIPIGGYTDNTIVTVPVTTPNQLTDATVNTAFMGLQLQPGITSPAGSIGDVIYWQGGVTFNNNVLPVVPM